MATIKDVAKRANVSTTTVSHVINKTRFVAEETRNAVWAAIKELHYSPSAVARSLKVNHTKSIGLLATSSEAAYFAEIIESVEKSCFQKGYTLILGNAWNDLEKQRAYLSMMAQKRVDGLLVMCSEYPRDNAPSTICFHLVIKLRYSSASGLTGNENEKSKILFAGAAGGDPRGAGGRLLLAALWQPGRITQDCPAAVRTPSATAAKPVAVRGSEPQGRLCAV